MLSSAAALLDGLFEQPAQIETGRLSFPLALVSVIAV